MLKIVKKVVTADKSKDNKEHVFYNIYLFGVAIRCVNLKDSSKLYYLIKGYQENNNN